MGDPEQGVWRKECVKCGSRGQRRSAPPSRHEEKRQRTNEVLGLGPGAWCVSQGAEEEAAILPTPVRKPIAHSFPGGFLEAPAAQEERTGEAPRVTICLVSSWQNTGLSMVLVELTDSSCRPQCPSTSDQRQVMGKAQGGESGSCPAFGCFLRQVAWSFLVPTFF